MKRLATVHSDSGSMSNPATLPGSPVVFSGKNGLRDFPRHSPTFNINLIMKYQDTHNRVLLASDDFTVRESLGEILRSGGFGVLAVENGRQAVKALESNHIKVIVLDYRTPFDVRDFASGKSRTLEALTDIDPLLPLVLTCDRKVKLDHASSLMADLVLTHPVVPSALLEGVETILTETLRERVHRKSENSVLYR